MKRHDQKTKGISRRFRGTPRRTKDKGGEKRSSEQGRDEGNKDKLGKFNPRQGEHGQNEKIRDKQRTS